MTHHMMMGGALPDSHCAHCHNAAATNRLLRVELSHVGEKVCR
jgi:hypothetical protein